MAEAPDVNHNGPPAAPDQNQQPAAPIEILATYLGRLYQVYPDPNQTPHYLFPADKAEHDRLDLFHHAINFALQGRHPAPESRVKEGSHVLDIGCGSGIWLIELAKKVGPMEGLHLVGVDLQMNQPPSIPYTVSFERADVEEPWTGNLAANAPYDYIHCQLMRGAIRSWPTFYGHVAAHLKPGTGVFEHTELDWTFRNDDFPLAPGLKQWNEEVSECMERHGAPLNPDPPGTRAALHAAGFVDIKEDAIMVPVSHWADDEFGRTIGRWFQLALIRSIWPMALAPLTRVGGRDEAYVEDLDDIAQEQIRSREWTTGLYCILYIWTAKIPPRD
ncbi:hypothetical protein MAPG_00389 [Magnaporthiopsis poae ATCC 64411]|uniref:Methyltransferase domain-containing protein n=1 Tax=Magnaporthiopsis poae (strain ATCC 64411 / 73-15) TaxID=644358 RepID=A0A0C4DKV7_MAGP6|nr:hypothetical protein MAPG_00389 [Magnaporthiopsis poae ATCC 64411]